MARLNNAFLSKYSKRDSNVELLRIIACFIVVCVHTKLDIFNSSGNVDFRKTIISSFVADGVAIFLMISGFYIKQANSSTPPPRKILHNLKIIPYVILYLAVDLIYCNTHDGARFADGIKAIFTDIFTLNTTFSNTFHLWYIYIFVIIVLIKPLLAQITLFLDKTHTWQVFMTLNFLVILWNDFSNNALLSLSHHSINALFPSILVMLFGNRIYKIRNKFKVQHCLIALIVFVAVNILRSFVIYKTYGNTGSIHLLFWFSSFGIISATALCVFILALPKITSIKAKALINYIGSLTMCIYLFHPLVITVLSANGILFNLQSTIIKSNRFLHLSEYTLTATLAVFAVSVVVSVIINILTVSITKISNIKQRRSNG